MMKMELLRKFMKALSREDNNHQPHKSKRRVLRAGESVRADGKYQFKYYIEGKPYFVYSWKLEKTDKLPAGKKPCLSLREIEKQIGYDIETQADPLAKRMTVTQLVDRYLATKTGVKLSTQNNYTFVKNILPKSYLVRKRYVM